MNKYSKYKSVTRSGLLVAALFSGATSMQSAAGPRPIKMSCSVTTSGVIIDARDAARIPDWKVDIMGYDAAKFESDERLRIQEAGINSIVNKVDKIVSIDLVVDSEAPRFAYQINKEGTWNAVKGRKIEDDGIDLYGIKIKPVDDSTEMHIERSSGEFSWPISISYKLISGKVVKRGDCALAPNLPYEFPLPPKPLY